MTIMHEKTPEFELTKLDGSLTPDRNSDALSTEEKNALANQQDDDFPDGGAAAWLAAVGASLVLFCTMGIVNSFGVFQAYYETHQLAGVSPSTISWIGSLQIFFMFASGLVGGPLFDRYGAKIIRPAIVLYVFSYMMTSLCTKYWQFMLAHGVLCGVSNGLTMSGAMAVTPQYFKKKRGAAVGVTIAGSSLGGLVMPIVLGKMLYSSLGFGWTMRILGFMFLALLSFAGVVIRARLPPRTSAFLLPAAFRNKLYSMLILACWFLLMGVFVPIFYLPTYAQQHGMSPQLAANLISILNGASVLGRVVPGILSDKLGRLNLLIASGISAGILIFCWPATSTNAGIIVFTAVFGFCSGGVVSGMVVSLTSCTTNPNEFGTYMGMGYAILAVPTLISPPINGALVSHYHQFNQAAYFSGAVTLFGGLLAVSTKFLAPGGLAWIS